MRKYDKVDWVLIALALCIGILFIYLGYDNGIQFVPILFFYVIRYWRFKMNKKRKENK